MTKSNLKKLNLYINLSNNLGFSKSISKKIVDDILNILSKLIREDNLNLKNIGSFKLVKKNEREGRNPKTKEKFVIHARNSISFSASRNLLNEINK